MPVFTSDDDLPPELRAISEPLRLRAESMGCRCRPVVNVDEPLMQITLEHNPLCDAWKHPAANAGMN